MNPPTRTNCIYCGSEFDLSEEQLAKIKPVIRKIEQHEPGYNLIFVPVGVEISEEVFNEAAEMLRLDPGQAKEILRSDEALPLARVAGENEASIVTDKLQAAGIEIIRIADEELAPGEPPKRLRGIEFLGGAVSPILFNPAEGSAPGAEVELIVTGTVVRREISSSEKKARGGENRVLDSMETGTDERIVDVYLKGDRGGYRIRTNGFDFSCLGSSKRLLVTENLPLLVMKFREEFPDAAFVDSYKAVRILLNEAWPVEEVSSSQGFERKGFGGFARLRSVATDNESQFTRFSKMHRLLLEVRK
jgi:hypothetical protein